MNSVQIQKLCKAFPSKPHSGGMLDNTTVSIFKQDHASLYHHSSKKPEKRHGLDIEKKYMEYHMPEIEGFDKFGPNEQYILAKLLKSDINYLLLVGGIGVGKTRFMNFLIHNILPSIQNKKDVKIDPLIIHIDFLSYGSLSTEGGRTEIDKRISKTLCDRIENEIGNRFYDIDTEVVGVWEKIFTLHSEENIKNQAIDSIIPQVRALGAEATDKNINNRYEEILSIRRDIRQSIMGDSIMRRFYLGAILRYINKFHYQNELGKVMILIDNIDLEPSIVQQAANLILKPFVRISGIRTVLCLRPTTFYQKFSDRESEPVDAVPYCGPSPMEIIRKRIDAFLSQPKNFCKDIPDTSIDKLVSYINDMRGKFIDNELIVSLFEDICGISIRKSLILAQHLIDNSVYDPLTENVSNLRVSDVLRAIMVGRQNYFISTSIIDNIFQVQHHPQESHFVKLRILRLVDRRNNDKGIKLRDLKEEPLYFGYDDTLILDALNEMIIDKKRLIWSDSVKEFQNYEQFTSCEYSTILTSCAGKQYHKRLFKRIDYVQEVMLDTFIDNENLGAGWDYTKIEDRFELVFQFLHILVDEDIREVTDYINLKATDDYTKQFGFSHLISREILEGTLKGLESILNSIFVHKGRIHKSPFEVELREIQRKYNDLLSKTKEDEKSLIGV